MADLSAAAHGRPNKGEAVALSEHLGRNLGRLWGYDGIG
jgi:hypothetical protein